jgi:ABC-type sugar transport system substrate-binding protein
MIIKGFQCTTSFNRFYLKLILVVLITLNCHLSWANKSNLPNVKQSDKVRVLLVNPSLKNDPFWHKLELVTQQAARELGIDLAIIYGQGTRYFQLEELKRFFRDNSPPDYILLINYPGHAKVSMDFLQKQKVKIITLEQTLMKEEKAIIGKPGEKYKDWLGEIYFDNATAGYMLAKELINTARKLHLQPVVAGISGHFGSESGMRNSGLQTAIKESGAQLTQIVHAGWSTEDAYQKTTRLLKRYPDINIIWCASDHMALGAIKAIEDTGKKVGVDILIGGFDWTPEGIKSIQDKKMTASIGGHFIMGAIAIMSIYNETHGLQHSFFINEKKHGFELALINQNNVAKHLSFLQNDQINQVSFKALIKLHTKNKSLSSINLLKILNSSSK